MSFAQRISTSIVIIVCLCIRPEFSFLSANEPTRTQLLQAAQECESLLLTSVVDFYLPSLDKTHGGYLENLSNEGTFRGGDGKFLTLQARQLWTFSIMAERGFRRNECLEAAKHGYTFLVEKFYDSTHGGYFNQLHDNGSVKDERKHAYLHSFVLYGLVAYHRATGSKEPLDKAIALFELLESNAYDPKYGGYNEFFHRDWTLVTDEKTPRIVGSVGTKTYNTHLHLLESFADLYRVHQHPLVRQRLQELMAINTLSVRNPTYRCNLDAWTPSWDLIESPDNLRASYGHDVECAWLVLDAAQALDIPEFTVRSWAQDLVGTSLKYGLDQTHGGFFYSGALGNPASDRHKEWWVQAEAMVCMLDMYRLTGDKIYWDAFETTFAFVKKHQIASEGGWWASRSTDGSPSANRSRTSMWQGGYHTGRSLLRSKDLLRQLATQRP